MLAVGAAVLALLSLANSGERKQAPATVHELIINVRGTSIAVAPSFLPEEDRGTYTDARTHDVVRLRFDWPSMRPFQEQASLPPRTRYRNQLSASIAPSGMLDAIERRQYLQRLLDEYRVRHVPNSSKFGLERTSLREGASSPFGNGDVLVLFGTADTLIRCSPDRDPDPGTPEARQLVAAGGLLRTPDCTQLFFVPELPNAFLRVHYQRIHLKDWAEIQRKVSAFIRAAMADSSARKTKPPA